MQPQLNRICGQGRTVTLEPRLMDLLVFLAARPGRVVSKDELIDGVWRTEFITEWAITRAIAKLRRALGDEAGAPRFIETISKRGYRLVAAVGAPPGSGAGPAAEGSPANGVARRGYVVGQWVRGAQFYGRRTQLAEVLDGPRDCLWVLGTRVSGKTSVLRQLELLADSEPAHGLVPVFWDLQGAEKPSDLDHGFAEALRDSGPRLEAAGAAVEPLLGLELLAALAALRRGLAERGRKLLLLCDEAEELLGIGRRAPALLRGLRRALQGGGVRAVLAASPRLWALAEQREDTSPFLHGFTPPVHLGPLASDEARALVTQSQLPAAERPRLEAAAVERMLALCGGHPYLLALLGERLLASGDLEAAVAEVEADPTLSHLFAVDLALLSAEEAALLSRLAAGDEGAVADAAAAYQLERLGMVRREGSRLAVGHHFLARWLRCRTA